MCRKVNKIAFKLYTYAHLINAFLWKVRAEKGNVCHNHGYIATLNIFIFMRTYFLVILKPWRKIENNSANLRTVHKSFVQF